MSNSNYKSVEKMSFPRTWTGKDLNKGSYMTFLERITMWDLPGKKEDCAQIHRFWLQTFYN